MESWFGGGLPAVGVCVVRTGDGYSQGQRRTQMFTNVFVNPSPTITSWRMVPVG
jgi:hypothetical protein